MTCCREIHRLTTPYVDAEASANELAAVEQHLRRCPSCQRRIAAERAARETLRQHCRSALVEGPPAPEALRAKLTNLPAETVALRASRWRQGAVAARAGRRLHRLRHGDLDAGLRDRSGRATRGGPREVLFHRRRHREPRSGAGGRSPQEPLRVRRASPGRQLRDRPAPHRCPPVSVERRPHGASPVFVERRVDFAPT